MSLARLSCVSGEGVVPCRPLGCRSQTTGAGARAVRGWQGNGCSTWAREAFCLPRGVSFQGLVCSAPARISSHCLRSGSLERQAQKCSSTCLFGGLHLKRERGFAVLRASLSGVSSEGRSVDDDDDGQSVEDSSSSVVEELRTVSGEAPISQDGGKPGFVSFSNDGSETEQPECQELKPAHGGRGSLLWLIGPLALVVSVVGPPLYLGRFFESILEDSLLSDFVILFCTEALFYVGVSLFLYISHVHHLLQAPSSARSIGGSLLPTRPPMGYRVSMIISVVLGVVLPAISFAVVWPWTGPVAAAALLPYLIGLAVQSGFEKFVIAKKSPVWSMVPVTFQVYRLHQLNRAAQLVAGLLFSLKAVEATPETLAVNGSLQSILSVIQMLGILCLWSLGSFLMHHFPAIPPQGDQATSVP